MKLSISPRPIRSSPPVNAEIQTVENAREDGTQIRRKPAAIVDNNIAEQLDRSGFFERALGPPALT